MGTALLSEWYPLRLKCSLAFIQPCFESLSDGTPYEQVGLCGRLTVGSTED